jgi:hypothetical protein
MFAALCVQELYSHVITPIITDNPANPLVLQVAVTGEVTGALWQEEMVEGWGD